MHQRTENAALTMRWTLETDAAGRTRPVAYWVPACAATLATAAPATIVQAA